MDKIDKFISSVSRELEKNDFYDYRWDSYERMFDFRGKFGYFDKYYNTFVMYNNPIDELLYNAFNLNPENCIRLIEYIFNKEEIKFDFKEIKEFISDETNETSLELPKLNSDELKIFISYSSEDYEKSKKIYDMLTEADIDCFLAKLSLKGGERWNPIILEKLKNSNVFILILSENFHNSTWCNQEASIAFLQFKLNDALFIPVCTDKIKPYGIFYDIQSINYNDFNSIEEFISLIDDGCFSFENLFKKINAKKSEEIDILINKLNESNNFYESNDIFLKLKNKNLSSKQVNAVIKIALDNFQVLNSFECKPFLSKNIRKYEDQIDSDIIKKLKEVLDINI